MAPPYPQAFIRWSTMVWSTALIDVVPPRKWCKTSLMPPHVYFTGGPRGARKPKPVSSIGSIATVELQYAQLVLT